MVMGLHPQWLLTIYLHWRVRARKRACEYVVGICSSGTLKGIRGEESEQRPAHPAFLHTGLPIPTSCCI